MTNRILIGHLRDQLAQEAQLWVRPLLVLGLLLLSPALPFLASQRQLILLLCLLVGVGLVLILVRWPSLGLVIAPSAGLVVPFLGPSGLNVTMMLVALLLGLWLMGMAVGQDHTRLVHSRPVWPLLSFVVIAFLAFGVGQLRWFTFAGQAPLGAQLGGLSILVLSAGTFLLAAHQVRELRGLKTATLFYLVFGTAYMAGLIVPGLKSVTERLVQSPDPGFWIPIVALAFGQAAFNGHLHTRWRVALGGLVIVIFLYEFALRFDYKSGWIPLVVCIVAIVACRSWRAGLVLIAVAILSTQFLGARTFASEEYSLSTRLDALSIIAQIIKTSPIWGLGFANYYWYTPLFPIRGYAVSFNSHNNYVDIVAQTGLVGLACFMWFLWEVGRLGWRLRNRVPAGFARAYVYSTLGGLTGMMVAGLFADWMLPFFYNVGLQGFRSSVFTWLLLGSLVSLGQIAQRQPAA